MKSPVCVFFILLLCLTACAAERQRAMPEMTATQDEAVGEECVAIFPRGRWQFIHAIDFSLGDGSGSTVIGLTSLDGDGFGCALLTIEGFTLFEAVCRGDGAVEVRRAVSPFDKPGFAEGLMRDVRMIFLAPATDNVRYGWLAGHVPVCRFTGADGLITDIMPAVAGCWRINTFTPALAGNRSLIGRSCRKIDDIPIPAYLELKDSGQADYTLKLTLLTAENLNR
ncbi:MAG: hypothetical protein HY885_04490 [Deltaproteobacteria bacterium]|nr:hypothetical protein [Deltaproteobacteria bacterium]